MKDLLPLQCKSDFSAAARRWNEFWRNPGKKPIIMATVPKPGVTPIPKPYYACGRNDEIEPFVERLLGWAETHEFLWDSIPFHYLSFASDHFAALLGADLVFPDPDKGGWPVHCLDDLDNCDIRFRPESKWWEKTAEFAETLKKHCSGKLLIAAPTLQANLDALVALRGAENVLLDLIMSPDAVKRALDQITRAHRDILDALEKLLEFKCWGSINRHGFYSQGAINVPQCDFSCMISPEMFREFVVPHLRSELGRFDGGEYHLDGPDAIRHLETLCEMPELDVIQWVPGSGAPELQDWGWLLDKIDELGKGTIRGGKLTELPALWNRSKSRRIVWNCSSKEPVTLDRIRDVYETLP
jgi:5-methyltetrahydrofolate--homocysteine methyltransferase